jgi:hypothetical protein
MQIAQGLRRRVVEQHRQLGGENHGDENHRNGPAPHHVGPLWKQQEGRRHDQKDEQLAAHRDDRLDESGGSLPTERQDQNAGHHQKSEAHGLENARKPDHSGVPRIDTSQVLPTPPDRPPGDGVLDEVRRHSHRQHHHRTQDEQVVRVGRSPDEILVTRPAGTEQQDGDNHGIGRDEDEGVDEEREHGNAVRARKGVAHDVAIGDPSPNSFGDEAPFGAEVEIEQRRERPEPRRRLSCGVHALQQGVELTKHHDGRESDQTEEHQRLTPPRRSSLIIEEIPIEARRGR